MNNDELKMIEEMAEVITQASDKCFNTRCEDCKYYRADDDDEGDDEIVIKKIELERLERSNYQEGVADGRKEIKDQYDVLREQYATLWAENRTLKDSNETLTQRNFKVSIERTKATRKETVKEILQIVDSKLDLYRNGVIGGTLYDDGYRNAVNEIKVTVKNKYDLELEQSLNENDERY